MIRPQAESIAIDKRDLVLQRKCTSIIGESDRICNRDQLRMFQSISVSCTQQVADRCFSGRTITLGRVLRPNQGHGGAPATVP